MSGKPGKKELPGLMLLIFCGVIKLSQRFCVPVPVTGFYDRWISPLRLRT